jgi:RNA polymerase sigma factor (sigma-70 family)
VSEKADDSLVARWREGDQQAAAELFRRYAERLTGLARSRLSAKLAQRVDAEDVVQSAYRSFFADTREGRYDLERGGDLWRLLVTITLRKLYHQVDRSTTAKRDLRREQSFSSEDSLLGLQAHLRSNEPSPVEALALADQLEQTMRRLEPHQRRILELRLQGYNVEEIAADAGCSVRTVRYGLKEIKQQLEQWNHKPAGS